MSTAGSGSPASPINTLFTRMGIAPRGGGFEMPDHWIWCPSVVRGEDGRYHMFASRWPKSIPFHPGWMTNSEVVHAISDTPEGPYQFHEVVFPARGAEYWDGRATHNPRVIRSQNRYVMFYTGITHPLPDVKPGENFSCDDPRCIVSRSNKRIGIATAESVYGPWKRFDQPILPTKPNTFYSFLTSNAAPCVNPDGSVLLMFKSRRYQGNVHSDMMIGVAQAKTLDGPYIITDSEPIFSQDKFGVVEDPFLWREGPFYRMIAKDMSGRICGQEHAGISCYSTDGRQWQLTDHPMAYSRTIRWSDGAEQLMGSMERPSLLIQDGKPTHFIAAVADGPGGFWRATRTWNVVIPLTPES